jgi:hypothetical protein
MRKTKREKKRTRKRTWKIRKMMMSSPRRMKTMRMKTERIRTQMMKREEVPARVEMKMTMKSLRSLRKKISI